MSRKTVAIIDDDKDQRDLVSWTLSDQNLEPYTLQGPYYDDMERLIKEAEECDYVLCDYKLMHKNYATFSGTDVVVKLYDRGKPALLITQYDATDRNTLNKNREKIPYILTREKQDEIPYVVLFEECLKEIQGNPSPYRVGHRAIITVDSVEEDADRVIGFIPAWRKATAVDFTLSKIPNTLRKDLKQGSKLIASVNIAARKEEDLFFTNFELAPKPVDEKEFKSAPRP